MRRVIHCTILLLFALSLATCATTETRQPAGQFTVLTHPDGGLYVGDRVSFEVLPAAAVDTKDQQIQVAFESQVLGNAGFAPYGVGGRTEAVLWWIWNTAGLEAGSQTLTFTVLPNGYSWEEKLDLQPAGRLPSPEPGARWESVTSDCCTLYYITGTAAERDLEILKEMADAQTLDVENRMSAELNSSPSITFLPRTLGHGGFTSDGIYISYLDRNYAGSSTEQILHHEMVHYLDAQMGGDARPTLLVEGLAVYLSGGHFKPEPLGPRAAALLDLGWFIPLQTLTDDFYPQQHEIGYLEAGALVQYLVETHGWEAYNAFYRDIHSGEGETPSHSIDAALQVHFGLTFVQLDEDFISYLRAQDISAETRDDLRLTVDFYDTVRRYQSLLDPSAYFMYAWLPYGPTMREQEIVADYLRHPLGLDHWGIESLLADIDRDLRAGNYSSAERRLKFVNCLLDTLER